MRAGNRYLQAASISIRRAAPFPAFVMPPCRFVAPLECSDGTRPRYAISWRGLAKRTISPRRRRLDCGDAVFEHDVMRRLLESQSGHPPTMHQSPRRPIVVTAMTQEEARELLTGLTQTADRRQTG